MFFVSTVRSAGGAANYFAKDNYYTQEQSSEWSSWGGKGATTLDLSGAVDKDTFEALLNSVLPDGTVVNEHENRRAGYDLTFSMPKSASVLAYVGGDERILEANKSAVLVAMKWVEENAAEVRSYVRDPKNGEAVRTGNLVYAMFQHDTSRALDPQAHIHVVVSAISQTNEGDWKALWNGELYAKNSTIGSIYHAALREELVKLGYDVRITGKHGQFEIEGVPKDVIKELSQRRQEILEKAESIGIESPAGMLEVAKRTRDEKIFVEDREALKAEWTARSEGLGYNATATVDRAILNAATHTIVENPIGPRNAGSFVERLIETGRLYIRPEDKLTTNGLARAALTPTGIRTEFAVASAIRIVGENEAAFDKAAIVKTALDLNLRGVTIDRVEARVGELLKGGGLIEGKTSRIDGVATQVTTPEHVAIERDVLSLMTASAGKGTVILPEGSAEQALLAVDPGRLVNPVTLTYEQTRAATRALSTDSRAFVIQGVAGAGKSAMIDAIARVAEDQGREVLGLSTAETTVNALRNDSNIAGQNISSFVNQHIRGAIAGSGRQYENSKSELSGKILILDEASLVGNNPTRNVLRIAQAFDVAKLIMIGDRNQLLPVEHGNTFAMIQAAKPDMAVLSTSQRQKTDDMKGVAEASRNRDIERAFEILGDRVVDAGRDFLQVAAEKWLSLSPEERARTDVYTSGRAAKASLNEAIQSGLKEEGTIKGQGIQLDTLVPVNLAREELRFAHNYENGMTLRVLRDNAVGRLAKGDYQVASVENNGRVWLVGADGKNRYIRPDLIDPNDGRDPLKLFEKDQIRLHEGDQIRWGERDKERDIFKSEKAKVISVGPDGITIENARGRVETVQPTDPIMKSVALSYAINMHQAQGMTGDKAIGVLNPNERNLSTSRLFHVMVTRVRYDMQIVTSNSAMLQNVIEKQSGDKSSALHAIGEHTIPTPREVAQEAIYNRNENIGKPQKPEDLRAYPDEHREPQQQVPEKTKERSL